MIWISASLHMLTQPPSMLKLTGFRASYAPIQMLSLSGKAFHSVHKVGKGNAETHTASVTGLMLPRPLTKRQHFVLYKTQGC